MTIRVRGAVLAETALFVSAALVFMLGTIQIGVMGFLQLTADSAAYYDARANILTVSSGNPETDTHAAFHQIPAADIVPTVLPAPTPTIPVDYGYNDPDPTVRQNSAVQRHGGASMMQPAQMLSTVTLPGVAHILGKALAVNGSDIEAKWVECGPHFEIANTGCSLSNPTTSQQTNYFSNGENTPLYFVGFDYMETCSLMAAGPWGLYTGANATIPSSSTNPYGLSSFNGPGSPPTGLAGGNPGPWGGPCASGSNNGNSYIGFSALGTAEYLDNVNWNDTSAGISGPCDTSAQPNAGTNQSVFEAIAFHQRTYATIAQYFQNNASLENVELYSYEADPTVNKNNLFGAYCNTSCGGSITAGGLAGSPGSATAGSISTPEAITSFAQWEGFDDASDYPGGPSDQYNQAVQTVYSWDLPVGQGQPPNDPTYNNPTFPEKGCS